MQVTQIIYFKTLILGFVLMLEALAGSGASRIARYEEIKNIRIRNIILRNQPEGPAFVETENHFFGDVDTRILNQGNNFYGGTVEALFRVYVPMHGKMYAAVIWCDGECVKLYNVPDNPKVQAKITDGKNQQYDLHIEFSQQGSQLIPHYKFSLAVEDEPK